MKKINLFSKLCSPIVDAQISDVGYDCRATVGSPSGNNYSTVLKLVSVLVLILTLGVGNVWGTAPTLSDLSFSTPIVDEDFEDCSTTSSTSTNKNVVSLTGFGAFNYVYNNNASNTRAIVSNANGFSTKSLSLSAGSGSPLNVFIDGQTFGSIGAWRVKTTKTSYTQLGIYAQMNGTALAHADARIYIQNNLGAVKLHNGTNFNTNDIGTYTTDIIDICVIYNISGEAKTYGNSISLANGKAHVYINGTCVVDGSDAPISYIIPTTALTGAVFKVLPQATSGNKAYIDDVQIYDELPTAAASCSADPTIGTATVNTSFKLTSLTDAVSVSSGTCSPGSDCAWIDYGFAWSLGSTTTTPTVSNNKVQVGTSGTATSWATDASHKVQPSSGTTPTSWAVGSTYYVRTYGKNGKDAAAFNYGTAASFTLRSITFNSNGGSSVGPWYVNSGGTYSAPTAPTKTGYAFGGWYTDNSTFESAVDWTAAVSANKTYYAKWTASVYRITLDNESPTTSGSTYVDLTYNSSTHAGIINPKKTGYTFGGYWTADNGTGTMVINTSGVLQANVTNYTGAGGIWTKAATCTLYAKWTINNYSVTWKVNNTNYTTGSPSDNVNHGSRVAKLPTDPDPEDYCGQKFVGWTDATDGVYVHGTSTLFTTAGTAPVASGAQIFYAVFADYDE